MSEQAWPKEPWIVDADPHGADPHDADYWWWVQGSDDKKAFCDGSAGNEYSPNCTPETRDRIIACVNAMACIPDPSAVREQLAMASAIIAGDAKWLPFGTMDGRGEIAINGIRYCTRLDADGIPEAHSVIRAALAKLNGGSTSEL